MNLTLGSHAEKAGKSIRVFLSLMAFHMRRVIGHDSFQQ